MTTKPASRATAAARPSSALALATLRAEPWGLLAGCWLLAATIATVGHLDSELEWVMVALASSAGIGSTMSDPASELTTSMPERRHVRRLRMLGVPLVASFVTWLTIAITVAAYDATPAPGRDAVFVWSVICATQVAAGSVLAARPTGDAGIGPVVIVALAWLVPFLVPRFTNLLAPIPTHGPRWASILAIAIGITAWTWRDPLAQSPTLGRPRLRLRRPP